MFIVMAKSESGDDYGVIDKFENEPTEEELNALVHSDRFGCDGWNEDECDGPGHAGSCLYLTVQEI